MHKYIFFLLLLLKSHCGLVLFTHVIFLAYHTLQTFTANTNSDDVVDIDLPEPVVARYLKIVVLSWNTNPSMRMEVIGYDCSG